MVIVLIKCKKHVFCQEISVRHSYFPCRSKSSKKTW